MPYLSSGAMPPGRHTSTFDRGGPRGEVQNVQTRPSQHAENQYQGILRGLGSTSKDPICSKKASALKRLHDLTHFAVGCEQWDDARTRSTAQVSYTDPQVVYDCCDAPDKNMSVVELRQQEFNPHAHYRTEQRERFQDPGPMPWKEPNYAPGESNVFLGDDRVELMNQSKDVHKRYSEDETRRAVSLMAAGAGQLIPNTVWPKPPRCNPITGGLRVADAHDLGVANSLQWPRFTQNNSNIITDANVRNPILGVCTSLSSYDPGKKTIDIVNEANHRAPPLRSLGAIRPNLSGRDF